MKAEAMDELRLVVLRAVVAIHECRLGTSEAEQLLRLPSAGWWEVVRTTGATLNADQERRLRRLVELHRTGLSLFGEAGDLADWLRLPDPEHGIRPLQLALEEEHGLAACGEVLRVRLRDAVGEEAR